MRTIVSSTLVNTDQRKSPTDPVANVQIMTRDHTAGGGSSARSAAGGAELLFEFLLLLERRRQIKSPMKLFMILQIEIDKVRNTVLSETLIADEFLLHQHVPHALSQFYRLQLK